MFNNNFNISNILRGNPEQNVMHMLEEQAKTDAFSANVLSLVQKGDIQGLENIVKNVAREKGVDYSLGFNSFKQRFGL